MICLCSGGIAGALARAASEPQLPGNLQTGLRLACNLFANPHTKKWIQVCMKLPLPGYVISNSMMRADFLRRSS